MKKSILKFSAVALIVSGSFTTLQSCKSGPKDADIQAAIETSASSYPGLSASVKDGVATLSGTAPDEAAKVAFENSVKGVAGVKSVVNNITVAPPAPVAPVEITADDPLSKGLKDVTAAFPTVQAAVADGVVTLTGELKRSELPMLMKTVNSLKPKKVENKITLK
ncbi:MAG: BON domain-containing protein [Chitinophagaceae bacterium]|nr:MAG: BON domain-containing protein [Chitinophagaceae bacterium]